MFEIAKTQQSRDDFPHWLGQEVALLCKELTAAPAKALVEGCIALAHLANDVPGR